MPKPKKQFTLKKNVIAMSKDGTMVRGRSGATNGTRVFRRVSAGIADHARRNKFQKSRGFRLATADISDLDILDSATSATAATSVTAYGVSGDGAMVDGQITVGNGVRAFRWTSTGVVDPLALSTLGADATVVPGPGSADPDAGLPVISRGGSRLRSLAVQMRVNWADTLKFGVVSMTPYTSLIWIKDSMGAYTETGDDFPVQWAGCESSTRVARIGGYRIWQATNKLSGLAAVAYDRRIDAAQSDAIHSGAMDLHAFTLDGHRYQGHWRRLGLGSPHRMDATSGVRALFNATMQLDAPLNLTYRKVL